jgi:hypothetical protein
MLCIKQGIALVLFLLLVIVSLYIIPSIRKTKKENNELQKSRKFRNNTLFSIPREFLSFPLADHNHDVDIDLEVTYPHATLTVDEPVDISAVATIKPELFSNVRTIVISFDAAQSYLPNSDDSGMIKEPVIYLNKTQNNRMIGATKIFWPIEGKYRANFGVELIDGILPTEHSVYIITVYPKSEVAQIVTNKTYIDLAVAAYFLGVISVVKIIIDLLTSQ